MTHRDRRQTHLEKERKRQERERERKGGTWKMVNISYKTNHSKLSIVWWPHMVLILV